VEVYLHFCQLFLYALVGVQFSSLVALQTMDWVVMCSSIWVMSRWWPYRFTSTSMSIKIGPFLAGSYPSPACYSALTDFFYDVAVLHCSGMLHSALLQLCFWWCLLDLTSLWQYNVCSDIIVWPKRFGNFAVEQCCTSCKKLDNDLYVPAQALEEQGKKLLCVHYYQLV